MSTYTNQHNRVKENIAVGYQPCDRVTNQKVKFYNIENEYRGTFTGTVNSKSMNITGGTVTGVEMLSCTLVDSKLKTSGGQTVDVGQIGEQLVGLSAAVYGGLSSQSSALVSAVCDLSSDVSGLQDEVGILQVSAVSMQAQIDQCVSLSGSTDVICAAKLYGNLIVKYAADGTTPETFVKLMEDSNLFIDRGEYIKNGSMYSVQFAGVSPTHKYVTSDGFALGDGDYVMISKDGNGVYVHKSEIYVKSEGSGQSYREKNVFNLSPVHKYDVQTADSKLQEMISAILNDSEVSAFYAAARESEDCTELVFNSKALFSMLSVMNSYILT